MPLEDRLQRLRSFPRAPAPNNDASAVQTNLGTDVVELLQNILAFHVAHRPGSTTFGNDQAKGLRLVQVHVRPRERGRTRASPLALPAGPEPSDAKIRQSPGASAKRTNPDDFEALTVCEVVVEQGMLNVHGTLAGPCATLLIDLATFSPLFALGVVTGIDPSGFSTSMNIVWHAPASRGTTLRFVNTSLSLKPRMAAARSEVYDKETGKLLFSATQIVSPIQGLSAPGPRAHARL
ncbi:hypothetical protein C8Q79DRAFT_981388 [Trametes meyenii]|nr:hypothetical protein C8Q79DRAFT_981388 [Trametes meyenii]